MAEMSPFKPPIPLFIGDTVCSLLIRLRLAIAIVSQKQDLLASH